MSPTISARPRRIATAILMAIFALGSSTTRRAQAQESGEFDQFGKLNDEDAMARLDRFAIEMKSHPEWRGMIVAYNTSRNDYPQGTFLRLAYGYRNYLVKSRGVEADRISVVEGERNPEFKFQLWTLPRNELSSVSEETIAPEPGSPQLFDSLFTRQGPQCVSQFEIELYKLEDGLSILSESLHNHARARTWIVVHPSTRGTRASGLQLVNRSRQLLIKKGIRPERILTAVSSPRSSICGARVKIWIVPANSTKADEAGYYSQMVAAAESTGYSVRRIEFVGLQRVRDDVVKKQFVQREGDLLSRQKLEESLNNLNRLELVYPLTLHDVEARANHDAKLIDLTIYFRERPRRR